MDIQVYSEVMGVLLDSPMTIPWICVVLPWVKHSIPFEPVIYHGVLMCGASAARNLFYGTSDSEKSALLFCLPEHQVTPKNSFE